MAWHWIISLATVNHYRAAVVLFVLLMLVPLLIAAIGGLNLHGGTEERVRAWVLLIVGLAVTLAMLMPYVPADPNALISLQITLLFGYGYVLADWGSQALRYSLQPLWAHALVAFSLLGAFSLAVWLLVQAYIVAA
jgi:hypothetical protein